MIVSVPPNLPGLINTINPSIYFGAGMQIYSLAYIIGFFLAGGTYAIASYLFPAEGTLIDAPILSLPDGSDDEKDYNVHVHPA